ATTPGAWRITFSMPQKQPPARIATSRGPLGSIGGLTIAGGADFAGSQAGLTVASSAGRAERTRRWRAMRAIMHQLRRPRAGVTLSVRRRDSGSDAVRDTTMWCPRYASDDASGRDHAGAARHDACLCPDHARARGSGAPDRLSGCGIGWRDAA